MSCVRTLIFPSVLNDQEPINILSSTSVDPSLIPLPPLPPLPPIAVPPVEMPFIELGLNSWWPSGWVQWMLEHCHTTFGKYTSTEMPDEMCRDENLEQHSTPLPGWLQSRGPLKKTRPVPSRPVPSRGINGTGRDRSK